MNREAEYYWMRTDSAVAMATPLLEQGKVSVIVHNDFSEEKSHIEFEPADAIKFAKMLTDAAIEAAL